MIVLVPNVAPPGHVTAWLPAKQSHFYYLCRCDSSTDFFFPVKFNTNLNNNLSLLPDLDSNRISIRRRSYLSTFSVVWTVLCQILCLIFLKLEINILRQWRICFTSGPLRMLFFLAPPAERQRSFSNADSSVVRRPSSVVVCRRRRRRRQLFI